MWYVALLRSWVRLFVGSNFQAVVKKIPFCPTLKHRSKAHMRWTDLWGADPRVGARRVQSTSKDLAYRGRLMLHWGRRRGRGCSFCDLSRSGSNWAS
jgi:hypothetical protein